MKRTYLLSICLLATLSLFASEPITFSGGYTRLRTAQGQEELLLTQGAKVQDGDLSLEADEITLRGRNYGSMTLEGNVTVLDSGQDISLKSPSLSYDQDQQLLSIHSWVELEDHKNQLSASAGNLVYRMDTQSMVLESHVKLVRQTEQGLMVCRSDRATFDRKEQTLSLSGGAGVSWNGDDYQAHVITVDLESEEITMDGAIKGSVHG